MRKRKNIGREGNRGEKGGKRKRGWQEEKLSGVMRKERWSRRGGVKNEKERRNRWKDRDRP